jgi:hypothetical protein
VVATIALLCNKNVNANFSLHCVDVDNKNIFFDGYKIIILKQDLNKFQLPQLITVTIWQRWLL